MDTRIEPGYCWMTGEPTFEILSVFPDSHALAGHVNQVGRVLPDVVKITLIQTNGRHIAVHLHKNAELDLKKLWKLLIMAELEAHRHRQFLPNYNEEKAIQAHLNQLELLSHPLIGVI